MFGFKGSQALRGLGV